MDHPQSVTKNTSNGLGGHLVNFSRLSSRSRICLNQGVVSERYKQGGHRTGRATGAAGRVLEGCDEVYSI